MLYSNKASAFGTRYVANLLHHLEMSKEQPNDSTREPDECELQEPLARNDEPPSTATVAAAGQNPREAVPVAIELSSMMEPTRTQPTNETRSRLTRHTSESSQCESQSECWACTECIIKTTLDILVAVLVIAVCLMLCGPFGLLAWVLLCGRQQ